MFHRSENRRRGASLPFTIFRLLISLVLFLILGIALIQAFKYFSGTSLENDPITKAINEFPANPKGAVMGLLTSEETANMITSILSFAPAKDFKLPLQSQTTPDNPNISRPQPKNGKTLFKFAIVADSHNNNEGLAKALARAKLTGVKFAIGLGDFSDVGTLKELRDVKQVFEAAGLPYYVIPGDHDLWDSRDKRKIVVSNFSEVFGMPYQAFSDTGIRFILLYNSDNYGGVDDLQLSWLKDELAKSLKDQTKAIYIFLHEPLTHPTSDQIMGSARKADPATLENTKIKEQAKELLGSFKSANVAGIFAGDIHAFTSYTDTATDLNMVTVGALTKERNTEAPRFAIVDVYEDGSYNISDIEVNRP